MDWSDEELPDELSGSPDETAPGRKRSRDLMRHRYMVDRDISSLRRYGARARTHSKKQIKQIAASITRFGWTNPVLITEDGQVIAGWARIEAAKTLSLKTVPTLTLTQLSPEDLRAYVLADNKLALIAGWDKQILGGEFQALIDLGYDMEFTGFSIGEIDLVLDEVADGDPDGPTRPEDAVPAATGPAVSRMGDLWVLGRHRLLCGDTQQAEAVIRVLNGEPANRRVHGPALQCLRRWQCLRPGLSQARGNLPLLRAR